MDDAEVRALRQQPVVERQRQGGAPTEPHDSRRQGLVSVTLSTTLGSI